MMKNLFLFFCSWILVKTSFSQKDPATVLAEVQRKLDSVMKNNPDIKKYTGKYNQVNNSVSIPNFSSNVSTINPYSKKPDTAFLSKIKFPDKNIKALASLPTKAMNKNELIGFIANMKQKIMTAMGGKPLSVSAFDADALSNSSVMCWYAGDADKALEIALDAATKDPDNMNALNNLSGILNLCGFPYKSAPILEYIDEQDPGNSTVENNLGIAYLEMRAIQKAKDNFQKAVGSSQYHPEANYALACIEYKSGNKAAAQKYCENCLRGGYIGNAWTMLRAINPKAKLMELIKDRYKQPDFFNPHKYPLPEQCKQADQAEALTLTYRMYQNMLFAEGQKYERLYKTEADYVSTNLSDQMIKAAKEKRFPLRPFGEFANVVMGDIQETYGETFFRLQKYDTVYFRKMKELKNQCNEELKQVDEKFKDRADKAGEGNPDMSLEQDICNAKNEVANKYLPQFATLTEGRQTEWLTLTKDYFNDYAFWCYVASVDDHQYHKMFYSLVKEYLTMLSRLAHTELINCKANHSNSKDKDADLEFEEGKCLFKANIDVEVKKINEEGKEEKETPAKFEIDCDEFKGQLKLGGGVNFIFKTTPTGRTTLAFSAGWSGDNEKSKIGEYLPASVGGKMQFGLIFGGGQPADVNIKWDYDMKLPVAGKNSAGWSVSMNSGVEFHGDGILVNHASDWAGKNIFGLDPTTTKQINPNINMYKH